jgi:hypothetical protein
VSTPKVRQEVLVEAFWWLDPVSEHRTKEEGIPPALFLTFGTVVKERKKFLEVATEIPASEKAADDGDIKDTTKIYKALIVRRVSLGTLEVKVNLNEEEEVSDETEASVTNRTSGLSKD